MKAMLKSFLKKCILAFYRGMTLVLPVNQKTCVFMSNLGRSYGGNPKSIYERMLSLGLTDQYHCYFILDDVNIQLPGNATAVKNSRFRFYYIMATAGVIISDTRFPNYIKKRKHVKYLQTWHGTPLKKLALDMTSCHMAGGESVEEYRKEFAKNSATWDYLIVQNPFSEEIFRRCFAFDGAMLPIGYPRNDILFGSNNETAIQKLKQKYDLPQDKKIILYAPTWRDNSYYDKASYRMDAPLDYDRIYEEMKEEYVVLIKYHYMVRERLDFSSYQGFYRVMDSAEDISELYLVSELLITDYSSVMFDYSLLKRPMIFYVYDLLEYKEELRGFYFDFVEEAPGPLVTTTEQLLFEVRKLKSVSATEGDKTIGQRDMLGIESAYMKKYEAFCEKYHTYEYGDAAQRAIETVFQIPHEDVQRDK